MLSITFAVLNDALNLPPFSLLLVALTITDGMSSVPVPFNVLWYLFVPPLLIHHDRHDARVLLQRPGYRFMARDWPIDQLLLHHLPSPLVGCRHLCGRWISHGWCSFIVAGEGSREGWLKSDLPGESYEQVACIGHVVASFIVPLTCPKWIRVYEFPIFFHLVKLQAQSLSRILW